MTKVYIVHFEDGMSASFTSTGFTSVDKAKAYLWYCYSEEVIPNLPSDKAEEYIEEDAITLDESGFIDCYGWIDSITIED